MIVTRSTCKARIPFFISDLPVSGIESVISYLEGASVHEGAFQQPCVSLWEVVEVEGCPSCAVDWGRVGQLIASFVLKTLKQASLSVKVNE